MPCGRGNGVFGFQRWACCQGEMCILKVVSWWTPQLMNCVSNVLLKLRITPSFLRIVCHSGWNTWLMARMAAQSTKQVNEIEGSGLADELTSFNFNSQHLTYPITECTTSTQPHCPTFTSQFTQSYANTQIYPNLLIGRLILRSTACFFLFFWCVCFACVAVGRWNTWHVCDCDYI